MLSKLIRCRALVPAFRNARRITFNHRTATLFNGRIQNITAFQCRTFAKTRKTAAKKDRFEGTEYNLDGMTVEQDEHLEHMKEVFSTLNPQNTDAQKLIGDIKIDCDGKHMPIKAVASVVKKSAQIICINLYDESYLDATISSIESYESSFAPTKQDELTIFCAVPKITKEFKQKLVTTAKDAAAKAKHGIKRVEKEENKRLSAWSEALEQKDFAKVKKEVENQTSTRMKQVENLLKEKVKQLEK